MGIKLKARAFIQKYLSIENFVYGMNERDDLDSYFEPIKKLLLFAVLCAALELRPPTGLPVADKLITYVILIPFVVAIRWLLAEPIFEIGIVFFNRRKGIKKKNGIKYMRLKADQIAQWCHDEQKIDVEVMKGSKLLHVGAKVYCFNDDRKASGKGYYIDSKEYSSFNYFVADLITLTIQGKLNVVTMDGVSIKKQLRKCHYDLTMEYMTKTQIQAETLKRGSRKIAETKGPTSTRCYGEVEDNCQIPLTVSSYRTGSSSAMALMIDRALILLAGLIFIAIRVFLLKHNALADFNVVLILLLVIVSKEVVLFPLDLIIGKRTVNGHFTAANGPYNLFFLRQKRFEKWKFVSDNVPKAVMSLTSFVDGVQPPYNSSVIITYYRLSHILCSWEEE